MQAELLSLEKICTECNLSKPLGDFPFAEQGKFKKSANCKVCTSIKRKKYTQSHSGKKYHLNKKLIKRYGITLEEYDIMSEKQNHKCAICGGINEDGKRLHVDHCHTTGKIRKLLCLHCNHALGSLRDNPDFALSAAQYLIDHK